MILPERLVSWVTGQSMEEAKLEVEAAKTLKPDIVDVLLKED